MKIINPIKAIKKQRPMLVIIEEEKGYFDRYPEVVATYCPVCDESTPEEYADVNCYCSKCGQYLINEMGDHYWYTFWNSLSLLDKIMAYFDLIDPQP